MYMAFMLDPLCYRLSSFACEIYFNQQIHSPVVQKKLWLKLSHTCPRGYKTFFMLSSTEHEILTAFKN